MKISKFERDSDLQRKEFDGEKLATTLIKAEVGLSMNFAI